MKVRCLCGAYAGTVRDFPSHIARMLVAQGRAAEVGEPRQEPVERAVQAAPEQAMAIRGQELDPPRKIGGHRYPKRLRKVASK